MLSCVIVMCTVLLDSNRNCWWWWRRWWWWWLHVDLHSALRRASLYCATCPGALWKEISSVL